MNPYIKLFNRENPTNTLRESSFDQLFKWAFYKFGTSLQESWKKHLTDQLEEMTKVDPNMIISGTTRRVESLFRVLSKIIQNQFTSPLMMDTISKCRQVTKEILNFEKKDLYLEEYSKLQSKVIEFETETRKFWTKKEMSEERLKRKK